MKTSAIPFTSIGRICATFIAAVFALTPAARAQEDIITANTPTAIASSVFRLNSPTSLQLSGLGNTSTLGRGTFELTPGPNTHIDPTVLHHYTVSASNMLFTIDNVEYYVTGSGSYDILRGSNSNVALYQRMTLDLRVGDSNTTRRFTSGSVPLMSPSLSPSVINLTLRSASNSTTDLLTLRLYSGLVPAAQITPYTVDSHQSLFKRICYEPCDCVTIQFPMSGTFGLVALPRPSSNVPLEYAMVRVVFSSLATSASNSATWTGAGIQQYDMCPMGSLLHSQHMRASLRQRGTTTDTRFDSNCVVRAAAMPTIKAVIADHNFVCFNQVFDFTANPR